MYSCDLIKCTFLQRLGFLLSLVFAASSSPAASCRSIFVDERFVDFNSRWSIHGPAIVGQEQEHQDLVRLLSPKGRQDGTIRLESSDQGRSGVVHVLRKYTDSEWVMNLGYRTRDRGGRQEVFALPPAPATPISVELDFVGFGPPDVGLQIYVKRLFDGENGIVKMVEHLFPRVIGSSIVRYRESTHMTTRSFDSSVFHRSGRNEMRTLQIIFDLPNPALDPTVTNGHANSVVRLQTLVTLPDAVSGFIVDQEIDPSGHRLFVRTHNGLRAEELIYDVVNPNWQYDRVVPEFRLSTRELIDRRLLEMQVVNVADPTELRARRRSQR